MNIARSFPLCLTLVAFLLLPAFAQEDAGDFQEKRREIEARFIKAHQDGDLAAKQAALRELEALDLPEPPVPDAPSVDPSGNGGNNGNGSGGDGSTGQTDGSQNKGWFGRLIDWIKNGFKKPKDEDGPGLGPDVNEKPDPEKEKEAQFDVIIERADGKALEGEDAEFLVGQKVELRARLEAKEGGSVPSSVDSWKWTVPGSVIKSYALDIEASQANIWQGRADPSNSSDMHVGTVQITTENLGKEDRSAETISFYWKNEGQNRKVTVKVEAGDVKATGEAEIQVRRSDIPAREVYTEPANFSGNWEILPQHSAWHSNFDGTHRFIYFHREFLRAYNVWRELFGYLPIEAVESTDEPGGGLEKPTYLTEAGGTEESSQHGAKKLADFESITALGDDLESPWHNRGHGVESSRVIDGERPNSDMSSVARAPKCEVFFKWHTKIDNTAREYEYVKSQNASQTDGEAPADPAEPIVPADPVDPVDPTDQDRTGGDGGE